MTIYQNGGANPAALGVPGLYVNLQAPPAANLNGAPTDIIGVVGSASWGPVDSPVPFGGEADGASIFGGMKARKHDLMTQVHTSAMCGGRNFRAVRVTDGTDTAASAVVQTNGLTVTSIYTGSRGADIRFEIANGTKADTFKVTVSMPGLQPETFDNIAGTGATAWANIAAAINAGAGQRQKSRIVTVTAGASVTTPTLGSYQLVGGTDGAAVSTADLLGADTTPRSGLYALRNTGAAVVIVADLDDAEAWSTVFAFGLSECTLPVVCSPSGDTIPAFREAMNDGGIDTAWGKVLFGDWVFIQDGVNKLVRLVSPQGFWAGTKVAWGPHQSTLNKPLQGIVGTQASEADRVYSIAELQEIGSARGDVIVMNSAGGDYPSFAFGRNASSNEAVRQETYTTMTNYLARSLDRDGGAGRFVGRLITPDEQREAASAIGSFLHDEFSEGRIGNSQGTLPYSVEVTAPGGGKGVQKATVMVQYLEVIEFFLIDLTGGQTVQIVSQLERAA